MNYIYQPGDIFIFKAEKGEWLSQCIAWFTKSDVSHAAMVYREGAIVELGGSGVGVNSIETQNGGEVYILRHSPQRDLAPLIQAADKYLTAKTRYDFPALVILAGLLIYRRMTPSAKLFSLSTKILSMAGLALDKFIQQQVLHNPDRAMVCSQFVYQVYYDCGEEYRIKIKDGNNTDKATALPMADVTICLADYLEEGNRVAIKGDSFDKTEEIIKEDVDLLARELLDILTETEESTEDGERNLTDTVNMPAARCMWNENAIDNELIQAASAFQSKIKELMKMLHMDMPIDALFVTPGDLVYKAANLEQVGTINVKRVKKTEQ